MEFDAARFLSAVDMRFLQETRRSMAAGGSENLQLVLLILLVVVVVVLGAYAYRNSTYLGYLAKYYFKRVDKSQEEGLLGVILKGRFTLEIFMLNAKRFEYLCTGRIEDIQASGIRIDILNSRKIKKDDANKMVNVYFTPVKVGGKRYNCFRGFISEIDRRKLVVRKNIYFDYQSRRKDFRYQVRDQRMVRAKLWLLSPTDGYNAAFMLKPVLEVNTKVTDQNITPAKVVDISVNGMGVAVSPVSQHEDLRQGEDVVIQLFVYNETSKKYRMVWVSGSVKNKFTRKGHIFIGIQFAAQAKAQDDEGKQLVWTRMDPDHGMVGFAQLLAALS